MAYAVHFGATMLASYLAAQVLTRSEWTWHSPRVAILCWQAIGLAMGLCAIGLPLALGLAPYAQPVATALVTLVGDLATRTLPAGIGGAQLLAVALGVVVTGALIASTLRSLLLAVRAQRRHRELLALVARADPAAPGALVLDHPSAAAYCLPGVRPQVVVSAGTLNLLDSAELAAVLSQHYKVFRSPGNFNNEVGLPLSLLDCPDDAEDLAPDDERLDLGRALVGQDRLEVRPRGEGVGGIAGGGAINVLYGSAGKLTGAGSQLFTQNSPGVGGAAASGDFLGDALARASEQKFESLSGGQQARFQILLLELSGATMLLLDEPTDNLDLHSAEALEDGLAAFEGTVLAVTHDRWFARGFDRFLVYGGDGSVYESDEPVWDEPEITTRAKIDAIAATAELNRIASHGLFIGWLALDLGGKVHRRRRRAPVAG